MLLTLHNLAKTYKMLPSEALGRATTFDLYILDTFHRYSKYQERQEMIKQGKLKPEVIRPRGFSPQQLKEMAEAAKTFVHPRDRK